MAYALDQLPWGHYAQAGVFIEMTAALATGVYTALCDISRPIGRYDSYGLNSEYERTSTGRRYNS